MKSYLLSLICLLFFCCCGKQPAIEEYLLIPHPVSIEYTSGFTKLKNNLSIAYTEELANEAELLQSYLSVNFSINTKMKPGSESGNIILKLDTSILPDKKEGYIMGIDDKITIKANSVIGIFNGIQTLRQIIQKKEGKWIVQKAIVTDYSAFSWRAFMLDEGRYFKGKEVVFDLLDEMAELKLNVFHWGLTNDQGWRIEIKKYPKLTEIGAYRDSSEIHKFGSNIFDGKPHGGFYTQEEIKEVVEYAAKRHIMVVPEVNMPGHACAAIAAYPWLGTSGKEIKVPTNFGVKYDVFNVADPKVIQFFEDVIDEMIPLFPSPVFHIGGDEVRYNHWNESPYVRSYMTKNGLKAPAELQVYFTNNMSNLLAGKSRRMMGWNEITGDRVHSYQKEESDADAKNIKLAKGTIVHFWKGDTALIRRTIEKGYDVVNSYHNSTYLDYSYEQIPLKKSYFFDPIPEGLTDDQKKRILGLGCQMWGEFIPTVESMNLKIYPRIAAYSEAGWTDKSHKDYNRFLHALEPFLKRWKAKGVKYDVAK